MTGKHIAHEVHFTGLISHISSLVKYNCFRWNLKALLDFHGCARSDFILGKQFGFQYDPQTAAIYPDHIPLEEDLLVFHGIRLESRSCDDAGAVLERARKAILEGSPICVYAYTAPLVFADREAIEALDQGDDSFRYRTTILSGYDNRSQRFQITEPVFSAVKRSLRIERFREWFERERISAAISSEMLPVRNRWIDLQFSKNSFAMGPELCVKIMRWNIGRMAKPLRGAGIRTGWHGIRSFASDCMQLPEGRQETRQLLSRWYFQLLSIIQQRLAFVCFVEIAERMLELDCKSAKNILRDAVTLWNRARRLCYKSSRTGDRRLMERFGAVLAIVSRTEQDLAGSLGDLCDRAERRG